MNNYHRHGNDVYSYSTCILTRTDDGIAVVNRTYYSKTTLHHLQEGIRSGYLHFVANVGGTVINLYDVPMGATADDLKVLAKNKPVIKFGAAINAAKPNSQRVTASGRTEPLIAAASPVTASSRADRTGDDAEELRPTL